MVDFRIIVDLRINETLQIPIYRVPFRLSRFYRGGSRYIGLKRRDLVGTVSNCADAVRLETAPTGWRKCLFIFRIHHSTAWYSVLNCSVCYVHLLAVIRVA